MNWGSWLLWGFVATVVLTAILAGSQGLGMTRMNIPYLLGTIFTPNRDRAKLVGDPVPLRQRLALLAHLRRRLPRLGDGDLVARGADGAGPRLVRPGGRHARPAGPAPADGQRAVRADRGAAAGAAGLSGPALRRSHADLGAASPTWCSARSSEASIPLS